MARKDKQFNVRLDDDNKEWLDAKAKESRLSRTWLVNNSIREAKKKDELKVCA
ncbi:MAG: ribbon-helix-helix protein, CopG family [Pseudomonas sp.]|nr:ribbon-helix-helix protein, CopG family [Pseudomonas sp.]